MTNTVLENTRKSASSLVSKYFKITTRWQHRLMKPTKDNSVSVNVISVNVHKGISAQGIKAWMNELLVSLQTGLKQKA